MTSGSIPIDFAEKVAQFRRMDLSTIANVVNEAFDRIGPGTRKEDVLEFLERVPLGPGGKELVLDMAWTRKTASAKFSMAKDLFFTAEGLRWATPEIAARHCAGRMASRLVLDVTCGQGGQVMFLAGTCDEVVANDLDPVNCLVTSLNSLVMGLDNVSVLNLDCLSPGILDHTRVGCNIFSDPARPPGSRERSFDEIHPDPRKIMDHFRDMASGFCFEVPPYISLDRIGFDCEKEYISIDGRLNRLDLYAGELKESEMSALTLPDGQNAKGSYHAIDVMGVIEEDVTGFMQEIDPALVRAGLVENVLGTRDGDLWLSSDGRRTILLTGDPRRSPFILSTFMILGTSEDKEGVRRIFRKNDIGKVTLRYSLDPEDYWPERNQLERDLEGSLKGQLFQFGRYIACRKV